MRLCSQCPRCSAVLWLPIDESQKGPVFEFVLIAVENDSCPSSSCRCWHTTSYPTGHLENHATSCRRHVSNRLLVTGTKHHPTGRSIPWSIRRANLPEILSESDLPESMHPQFLAEHRHPANGSPCRSPTCRSSCLSPCRHSTCPSPSSCRSLCAFPCLPYSRPVLFQCTSDWSSLVPYPGSLVRRTMLQARYVLKASCQENHASSHTSFERRCISSKPECL